MKASKRTLVLMSFVCAFAQSLMAQNSPYIKAVDEYVPAPGQFINTMPEYEEGDDAQSMAAKCTDYLANNNRSLVSLGGWGGYITFHFDHPVVNVKDEYDLYITGNAFLADGHTTGGSSEPGIVMVSRDTNGNGLPDDEWYELSGSADVDSIGKVIYGYELTYTRQPMADVPWTDNQGGSGAVARNKFHRQEYYPQWIDSDQLTFRGTRLPNNGYDESGKGSYWVLNFYRYGYVDNKPNTDRDANSFNIEWAVDADRNPVHLDKVDFVRVYSAMNQMCGWLGETSTEIIGAEDLHPDAVSVTCGDANADGVVTVADIVATANHILGNTPTPFDAVAADSDGDGNITVSDIVTDARIILK